MGLRSEVEGGERGWLKWGMVEMGASFKAYLDARGGIQGYWEWAKNMAVMRSNDE